MAMRLRLGDWPPMISHLAAFFMGTIIAGYSVRPAVAQKPKSYGREMMLPLPSKLVKGMKENGDDRFIPVTAGADATCRSDRIVFHRVAVQSQNVVFRVDVSELSLQAVLALWHGRDHLAPASQAESLPLCKPDPRVTYGE